MSTQGDSMVHTRHIHHRYLPVISVNAKIRFNLRILFSQLMINITLVLMGVLIPMSFIFRTSKQGIVTPPPLPLSLSQKNSGILMIRLTASLHALIYFQYQLFSGESDQWSLTMVEQLKDLKGFFKCLNKEAQ